MNYLYILEITLLSIASSANIFSRSIGYLFLFMVSFAVQKLLSLVAAAAAKSLQSCLTLCDAIDSSPPGSSIRGIFQARVLEWGAIAFSSKCGQVLFIFPFISFALGD